MRWNDLISQKMQDPSEDALTAFEIRIIKLSYLIIIFSYLNRPNSTSVFLHACLHDLALLSQFKDADFTLASTAYYSLAITGQR